jgi:hypothetical protein
MKVVIVYESMYGNTHHIANAIGDGLEVAAEVMVVPVEDAGAELVRTADLLVVGGPTHVHGMTRASTRKAALDAAAKDDTLTLDPDAPGPGLRGWFDGVELQDRDAVAFDTRMHGPPAFTGRASKGIASRLRHHGAKLIAGPESFLVTKENHLDPGEEEHARAWGARLASVLTDGVTAT